MQPILTVHGVPPAFYEGYSDEHASPMQIAGRDITEGLAMPFFQRGMPVPQVMFVRSCPWGGQYSTIIVDVHLPRQTPNTHEIAEELCAAVRQHFRLCEVTALIHCGINSAGHILVAAQDPPASEVPYDTIRCGVCGYHKSLHIEAECPNCGMKKTTVATGRIDKDGSFCAAGSRPNSGSLAGATSYPATDLPAGLWEGPSLGS